MTDHTTQEQWQDVLEKARIQLPEPDFFCGWGMITRHAMPWDPPADNEAFLQATRDIKDFIFSSRKLYTKDNIDTLMWRHYVIDWCVRYVVEFGKVDHFSFVECGTAFGWSAFFTMRRLMESKRQGLIQSFATHVYDAFMASGKYGDLSQDKAESNLSEFLDVMTWHPGYLPGTLHEPPEPPDTVNFLHIDINTAQESIDVCEFYLDRFGRRGLILFDDYGHKAHKELKSLVDAYFAKKPGLLLPLPTGQSVYFVN